MFRPLSRSFRLGAALLAVCPAALAAHAQQSATPPQLQERGGAAAPHVEQVQPLNDYQRSQMADWARDFADLHRYRPANQELGDPVSGERRVIFFGDSITDKWTLSQYFPDKHYINRGISGQTTSQMLLRFRQDVINLHPDVVVVLAGTNDIAGNTGPISIEDIEGNITSMAELARAHDIALVLSSVTPVNNYTPASQRFFADRPPSEILRLNEWMKAYCTNTNCYYLDYFDSMVDGSGLLKRGLSEDGLHPNDAGYKIMAPLAESAIDKTMASR
ncbi:MAG: SGNH/GDSL hydrolase family protein [Acidobacteriaceae bacterium]